MLFLVEIRAIIMFCRISTNQIYIILYIQVVI